MVQTSTAKTEKPEFTKAFSSFSVNDLIRAADFYGNILGLDVGETDEGLRLEIGGYEVFIYPKDDHEPATFTVLNLMVEDIASAVAALKDNGVEFESYTGEIKTDENNIMWGKKNSTNGPNIAWFKDPAGNFISVIEE